MLPSNRLTQSLVVVLIITFSLAALQVAVANDTIYAIGGETLGLGSNAFVSAVNEQYTPVGYGTPDPSPSPTPSSNSTPFQKPTSTPEPKQPISIPTIWIIAIAALVAVVIIELIIIYFLKAKRSKS